MSSAKSLTWIHLSDLHFGHGKEAGQRFDQKLVTDKIIRDAELVAGELGPPDVVFLTGDIAFSASADREYSAAEKWLGELLAVLKIGSERLLLVPGNHDVDRKKAGEGQARLAHKLLRADPNEINELLEKPAEMEGIWPKLAAYRKFASAFGSPEITPARPFWTKRLSNDLGPVDVIGLNTTLLSFDSTDSPSNLALGLGQIHQALKAPARDALLLVLQHHPPGWLRDGNELRAMLKEWPHLLLSGHVHDQQGFVTLPVASRGNVELVAGAGHQDAGDAGEHAYAWGRLTREGLEYYPRAWHDKEMSFLPQRIHPPEDQKDYTSKLGEFARFPREKLPGALASWLLKNVAYSPAVPTSDSIAGKAAFRAPPSEPVAAAAAVGVTVAAFDPANSYFSVPYRAKGDQVIGRADALLKVREQLEKGRRTAIGQTAAFVGLGGLGKTQVAVEYAHQHKNQYPRGVYWFNADGDLDGQLTRLAVAAQWVSPASEPNVTLKIAKHQIRTRSDCLIVFDNVEDLAVIEDLLPESSATPHLLITSRVSQVGFDPVPIDRLLENQCLELLCTESGRSLENPGDYDAALRIAKELEGLPLALELAGAYLRRSQNVSWTYYADLLENEGVKARGLRDSPLASFTKHNANLYATLHIDEAIFEGLPLLREALDLLAWSGSSSMGRDLLTFLLGNADPAALDVALGEAETLRILRREQGATGQANSQFHMHRLMREVRRAEVPLQREPARWLEVLDRLGNWFEKRGMEVINRPSYEGELNHLEVWQGHAVRLGYGREAARLLWLRSCPYANQGQFQRARDTLQSALALFVEATVVDPKLEADLCNELGSTLGVIGDPRKAIGYLQRALKIRREVLGRTHPDTAASLYDLGLVFMMTGEYRKALYYQRAALEIRREVLGENHPDTGDSLQGVGLVFTGIGEHRKALDYQRATLEIRREVLGENHLATISSIQALGFAFCMLGESCKALDFVQRALATCRKVFGEKHPATATSLDFVGLVLGRFGNHREALSYQQRALRIYREISSEEHFLAAVSFGALGRTLIKIGDPIGAFRYMSMSLTVCRDAVGGMHQLTIRSWEHMVGFLLHQHKKAEALALVENDLRKFPHNATLKRLKKEILGKRSAKASSRPSVALKKSKAAKR